MNKEETIKDIQNIINANCWAISEQGAKNIATALYNAGYEKVEKKDETAIQAMLDFIELLEQFDEMGYAPTNLCDAPEEEANKWKGKALANFEVVLKRIEKLTFLLNYKDQRPAQLNETIAELRADIAEKDKLIEEYSRKNIDLGAKNAELSLKLRQGLLNIDTVKEINDMCNIDMQRKQAVHDFAHPILWSLQCRIYDNADSSEYIEACRALKEYLEEELRDFDNE